VIGRTLAHYRVVEKIGAGGMGEVYRATDTKLGRDVALKILPADMAADPDRLSRFRREAQALAALSHPNIVTIHSIEEADGVHFLAMELVVGRPLGELIPSTGLELGRFLELALPLVDAVSAAHDRGITHRDLKPPNVMVSDGGRLAVLDFGIAKLRGEPARSGATVPATEAATRPGSVLGTTSYMSPEQLHGRDLDHRSDVFSLGVVLYEMITGRRPFHGASEAELASSILRDETPAATDLSPSVPPALDRILRRCLEKDASRRYQSTRELRSDLAAIGRDTPASPRRPHASIAVLPFDDMSAEKDQDYFCEGVAEEIINALTKIPDLRVAARAASFGVRNVTSDVREIGTRLGVETLLGGSVRKSGDRVRITAQLIDVSGGYHLWSERFDRRMEDIFAIQDEIAQAIASALEVTLGPKEERSMKRAAPADMRAYEFYLRGRRFVHGFSPKNLEFARRMFTRAIEIDAGYAPAWAGLADTCSFQYMYARREEETRVAALEAGEKALKLAPDLAEAHSAHAYAVSLWERWEESEAGFDRALALEPASFDALYLYGRVCFAQGKLEKAARLWERAMEVRPEDYTVPALLDAVYHGLGDAAKRRSISERAVELIERHLELNPDDVRAVYFGAGALVLIGRVQEGLEWAQRALDTGPDDDPSILYNVACVYAKVGDVERAIDLLERVCLEDKANRRWMENDHDIDPLRDHPRFRKIMDSLE